MTLNANQKSVFYVLSLGIFLGGMGVAFGLLYITGMNLDYVPTFDDIFYMQIITSIIAVLCLLISFKEQERLKHKV